MRDIGEISDLNYGRRWLLHILLFADLPLMYMKLSYKTKDHPKLQSLAKGLIV